MSNPWRDLANAVAQPPGNGLDLRVGVIATVEYRNDGGGAYPVVTIDGYPMRCLAPWADPAGPQPGQVVAWLRAPNGAICFGTRL